LEEIRRMDPVSLVRLPAWMRDSIARIARAVTDRRVGVALSGGGAWSFAHLALLEAMHQERIPIDMVSGASGGSLVAAYYCCRGRQGLQMLRDAAGRIDVAVVAAALCTTRALGWAVDVDLESRRLRDLDVPFYPIVADLDAGAEFVPRRGALRVGDCVRASSTLVPLTSTTRFEGRRCADGVFVNNTGERVLAEEGADLIVASDVVQTPSNAKPGSLLDVLVPPAARIRDATAGAYLLTRSADDRDAFLASCRFHPERLPTTPILFSLAKFNESVARPQAETFVTETLKPLWERLRAP
jgi:predicted acylesterase/phospholipase RssA